MRKSKRECAMLNAVGDKEGFSDAALKLKQRQEMLKAYCKEKGLSYKPDRTAVEGYNKSVSGKAIQSYKSLAKQANKMYNLGSEVENIKAYIIDLPIRQQIQTLNKTIESGKQGKHILGHNNYIAGKSYLTISEQEAQKLVNKYAGTGEILRTNSGQWNNKEIITADREIGIALDLQGNGTNTNSFVIHYSKTGVHIVPIAKKKGD